MPHDATQMLVAILEQAKREGHLGPGPVASHISHGRAHVSAAVPRAGERWCDLGSGGGVPGLILAEMCPEVEVVLLDRSVTRTGFLERAVDSLGWQRRVEVVTEDAADAARQPEHFEAYDGIVSRAFGAPALVAELSAMLLRVDGLLVVSEPPRDDHTRWPAEALDQLGMRLDALAEGEPSFAMLRKLTAWTGPVRRWNAIRRRPRF